MSKSLDGKTIRIKGTTVTTTVRYCTDADGYLTVVTEMNDLTHPEAKQFVTEVNPYGDMCPLDMIELRHPNGGWYTPEFRVRG